MDTVYRWKTPISHCASCSLGEKAQNGANIPKPRGLRTQTLPWFALVLYFQSSGCNKLLILKRILSSIFISTHQHQQIINMNSCKPIPKTYLFSLTMDLNEEQEWFNTPTTAEGLQSSLRLAPPCLLHFPWMHNYV